MPKPGALMKIKPEAWFTLQSSTFLGPGGAIAYCSRPNEKDEDHRHARASHRIARDDRKADRRWR
jgi:hypothetical protein